MLLEIQTEGAKVTGGVVCVDHRGRRDGDEELVAGSEFEQSSLVNGVQGVFGVRSPALGAHTFQELEEPNGNTKKIKVRRLHNGSYHTDLGKTVMYLYGAWIGGFLVDALHQLVAGAALVPVTRCWGWIPKIHLEEVQTRGGLGQMNVCQFFLAFSLKKHLR